MRVRSRSLARCRRDSAPLTDSEVRTANRLPVERVYHDQVDDRVVNLYLQLAAPWRFIRSIGAVVF